LKAVAMMGYKSSMASKNLFNVSDLAKSVEFEEFFDILYGLVDTPPCLRDPQGEMVKSFSNRSEMDAAGPICRMLLETSDGADACHQTNRHYQQLAAQLKRPLCYHCHAGLLDFMVPVFMHHRLIAFINGGQFFDQPITKKNFHRLRKKLAHLPIDEKVLEKAYFRSTYTPKENIDRIVRLVSFFAEFFCEMSGRLTTPDEPSSSDYVEEAQSFIKANFTEDLSRDQIADHVGLSANYFSSLFKEATGESISAYLNQCRLDYAKKRLERTKSSITRIAYEAGFSSPAYFNQVFKEAETCTPRAYRKKFAQSSSFVTLTGDD